MTELVVHELVTVTTDEAGRLEEEFLNGLDQAQDAFVRIMETNAWAALGHDSFAAWWERRVVPVMRALSMRPTREITDRVLEQVRREEEALPAAQRRTQRELAELAGTSEWTVAGRKKPSQDRPEPRVSPAPDLDDGSAKLGPDQPEERAQGCESCGAELDVQNAQVGYLRCEDCDSEGDHVAATFPMGSAGVCVACQPEDPQAREWLESSRPENVFGKYYDPEKHGVAPAAAPESAVQPERPAPPRMTAEEFAAHQEDVRRVQDIDAAHRQAQTIVAEFLSMVVTVVTGCRYGETGLVNKEMVAKLREGVDLLEGELSREQP